MRRSARLPSASSRLAVVILAGTAAGSILIPGWAESDAVVPLPAPRIKVAVQGADDVEHYVARQVGMGYFEGAAAAKHPLARDRVTDVEVWLTPSEPSRFRAWVNMGAAAFAVTCPPDQCHSPYDLGKRVAAEVAARQSDQRAVGVASGE